MLTYDLDKRNNKPLYEYLYECIRQDIIEGKLAPGERLPSKRTLAHHLNVGVITVANAYEQLAVEGYLTAREKSGYYVENITNYRVRTTKKQLPQEQEQAEPEYLADFKANRISLQNFPLNTWNRLLRETLSEHNEKLLQVVPYNGVYELRLAIAEYLQATRAMEVDPAQIIIGAGTEYLYSRILQLLGHNTSFAIEDPGYKKFASIAASFGNDWHYIPIDKNGLLVDKLEESGADIVHVSPANHFPTGIVMPVSRRIELFEWVNRISKRYIIEDDYDSEFRYSGHFIPPLFAQDTQNKVIYINTFSKSLVPSLRISYMVLPPKLLQRYQETQSFYSCTVSSFEQYALARFIKDGYFERHLNKMKNYYREQRANILNALKSSTLAQKADIIERNAGTHFLLEVDTSLSEEEVRLAAAKRSLHLSFYSEYSHEPVNDNKLRLVINYAGIAPDKISLVVETLASIFEKQN